MQVELTAESQRLLEELRDGLGGAPAVLVEEALRRMAADERSRTRFRELLAEGIRDYDEGRAVPLTRELIEEIKQRGRARFQGRARTG